MTNPAPGEAFYLDVDGSEFAHRAAGTFPALMGAEQMTWAFWIKTAGISGKIGGAHGIGDPNRVWWFEVDDQGRELMIVLFNPYAGSSGSGEPVFRVSTGAPFNAEWQFVIVQFDGTRANPEDRLLVWINSALADLVVPQGFPSYPLPSQLASSPNAPFEWGKLSNAPPSFVGQLGELSIVRRLLAPAERDEWFYGGIRFDAAQVAAGYAWRRNLDDLAANGYHLSGQSIGSTDFGSTGMYPTYQIQEGPSCLAAPSCSIQIVGGEEECVCSLEGLDVTTSGATLPPPPPPPAWPEFPGWTWPDPDQYGALPYVAPPEGGGACDPNAIEGNCSWTASLRCPVETPRGGHVTCTFSVEPTFALDYVSGWTFQGAKVFMSTSANQMTWAGVVVESGQVRVDFRADGRDHMAVVPITVTARTGPGWQAWADGAGFHYSEGTLLGAPSWPESRVGIICRPDVGCPTGQSVPDHQLYVQPQNPTDGNGYSLMPVTDGGPNHGTWYLSGVGFDVQLASAFNPDYFAAGTTRPQGCGPVEALSFWDYNLSACANNPGGWDDLWTAFAHDHEQIHVSNGLSVVTEPGAWYRYNLPTSLESWVESGANQLESRVGERVQRSGRCLTAAVSSHQWHGFPNFPIWFWQGSEFLRWQPGQSRVGTPLNLALNEIDPNLNCDAP